jgi:alpha-D-xyloside xylohydrolase
LTNYSVEWNGFIQARRAGAYRISVATDDGVRLWIDGQEVVDDWTSRAVKTYSASFDWTANSQHRIRMQYYQNGYDATAQLAWIEPSANPMATWTAQAADSVNYYFLAGPEPDAVIANYRHLTGDAPMFGKWAWGYWQSKEHYATQQQITNIVGKYRSKNIPIDGIVQDWYYWNPNPWGSHDVNVTNYPDVKQLMHDLHEAHTHMIISVWGRFDQGNYSNYVQLKNAGALYPQVINGLDQYYDPFNPAGRQLYWQQIAAKLFAPGIDGWWLDASEPELSISWGEYASYTTAAGPAARVFNAYPLLHTTGVYQGQRADSSSKRVFILTRSAYAGQQRNSAVTWSGDIQPTWQVFNTQIPAGVNFSVSGIPYWNSDIGGFFQSHPSDPAYAELFTRWFQFGAFCPMFRVHGETAGDVGKEMWQFPPATEAILIHYDQLRYHLLPYIYSVSWMVTSRGYSMMRPLVMDFRSDANVYNISDQYLFGPALLVNPVMQAGAASRAVYLPTGASWWNFWTGESVSGGQTNQTAAPIDTLPLYVRAGSIIPYGPAIQYATQSVDPIELRVYRGANGAFTLYEDENDNYNYEHGVYATIPFVWNESAQTLTIGPRQGSFPGMLTNRTFNVVWVAPGHGVGVPSTTIADVTVPYSGQAVTISPAH